MKFIVLVCIAAFIEANAGSDVVAKRGLQHHCYATGDPHYKTFDNKYFDFMGHCKYVHVTDSCPTQNGGKPRLGHFKVIADTGNCARNGQPSRVSCVNSVDIIIGGEKIHLSYGTTSPAPMERPLYSVTVEGAYVVVRTKPAGLTVKWNRGHGIWVYLDERYRGKVCGLCGNFDGNPHNDVVNGHPWRAGGKCGVFPTPKHPCETKPHRRAVALKDCAVIKSHHFANCKQGGKDLDQLYHNCVYDVCAETVVSMKDSSCEAIKSASEECNGKLVYWGHLKQKCHCQIKALVNKRYRMSRCTCQRQQCCRFPFKHRGKLYYGCKPRASGRGSFCRTVTGRLGSCISNKN